MQLPLILKWNDAATFDNFYAGQNEQALVYLQNFVQGLTDHCLYLYGTSGVGLSHLLCACCQTLHRAGLATAYLPLAKSTFSPAILDGLESLALICLDDIEAIAGKPEWEEHLFHCYNRLQNTGTRLLITGRVAPTQQPFKLPDLASRIAASVVFQIKPLSDEDKLAALQLRARSKGLELTAEVGHYLLSHYSRDTHALFAALEKLDQAVYIAQRRLTIPFVKTVLSE